MKKIISLLTLVFLAMFVNAQQKPAFWDDVQAFKKLNKENGIPKNAILFVGSSSFTKWTDVADYFPGKTIINRGFGGSTLLDLNFYSEELLKPYHPNQIFIYCGENDLAAQPAIKPRTVLNRFKNFYATIRKYYPTVEVDYVSIKYSPSRENIWPKVTETNRLIENFMKRQQNAKYIDITKAMRANSGQVREDLFLEDRLHMKPEGYVIWAKEMTP